MPVDSDLMLLVAVANVVGSGQFVEIDQVENSLRTEESRRIARWITSHEKPIDATGTEKRRYGLVMSIARVNHTDDGG